MQDVPACVVELMMLSDESVVSNVFMSPFSICTARLEPRRGQTNKSTSYQALSTMEKAKRASRVELSQAVACSASMHCNRFWWNWWERVSGNSQWEDGASVPHNISEGFNCSTSLNLLWWPPCLILFLLRWCVFSTPGRELCLVPSSTTNLTPDGLWWPTQSG